MNWCAAFVDWCCNQLGANLPAVVPDADFLIAGRWKPTFASQIAWARWADRMGFYHSKRDGVAPERGDLVLFDWDGGATDHIGVVLAPLGGRLETAEGNTTNSRRQGMSGAIKRRSLDRAAGWIRLPDGLRL